MASEGAGIVSESSDQIPTWVGKVVETEDRPTGGLEYDDRLVESNGRSSAPTAPASAPEPASGNGFDAPGDGGQSGSGLLAPVERRESTRSGLLLTALLLGGGLIVAALAVFALTARGDGGSDGEIAAEQASSAAEAPEADSEAAADDQAGLETSGQLEVEVGDQQGSVAEADGGGESDGEETGDGPTPMVAPTMELYEQEAAGRSRDAYGVLAAGQLQLLGTWESRQAADALASRASVLVGEQNVAIDAEFLPESQGADSDGVSPVLFVDQPLTFADDGSGAIDPSARLLLESAGALMALYPDTRITLIVPGWQNVGSGSDEPQSAQQVENLVQTLEQVGVPAEQISVEPSAATTDPAIAPFVMMSGGLFVASP